MSYLPSPEKLASLGYGMPSPSWGRHASVTYFNIEQTKAVVIWPGSQQVRLAVKPSAWPAWSDLFTGVLPDEEAFGRLMITEGFIMPEQLQVFATSTLGAKPALTAALHSFTSTP